MVPMRQCFLSVLTIKPDKTAAIKILLFPPLYEKNLSFDPGELADKCTLQLIDALTDTFQNLTIAWFGAKGKVRNYSNPHFLLKSF